MKGESLMKKRVLFMLFLLLMISVIAIGCSSGEETSQQEKEGTTNEEEEKETTEVSQEEVEVDLVMYSWRPEDKAAYEKIIAAFNEENPTINITFESYKSTEYNTILTNSLVGGSGPDIVQLRSYEGIKSIADNDYLVPLDDLPGITDINADFLNSAKGSDGKIYGVPLALNSGVIWYNNALFEKHNLDVPETWDELIEVSNTFKDNGVIPIAQGGRAAYLLSMTHSVISPSGYGANDYVSDVVSGDADLLDSRFIDSVKRMKELEDYFPQDFIALDDNDAKRLFFTEQAAMYINGSYRLATFEENVPDMDIGVIPGLAIEKGGEAPVSTWVDGSFGLVKNSEHQEAGLKFIEFMASKKFGQMFSDELNRLSAINGVQPKHPITLALQEAIDEASTPYFMLVHYGKGSPTGKTVFENSLQGLYLGELTVEKVAQEAQDAADRAE
jgi:raffinose/stachyose/melibiose transport system substrate-binding protein